MTCDESKCFSLSDEGDAIERFMGCELNASNEAIYNAACPSRHLPFICPVVIAVGSSDTDVPPTMLADFVQSLTVEQSEQTTGAHSVKVSIY